MWLLRDTPPHRVVSVVLRASNSRGRASILGTLRSTASATHCRIALAETRGVAVRWVDGIVSGTAADLAAFLTVTAPVLARARGHAELAA